MQIQHLNLDSLLAKLPPRERNAHKGDFGHVLIVGGDFGYAGAPVLAALGALRVGAGLVTLASHNANLTGLNAVHPEIMTIAIDDPLAITKAASKATVIVLGPGLGRTTWSQQVYQQTSAMDIPQVVDADALFFLAQQPKHCANWIITPHPGEARTLLQSNAPITDRVSAINALIDKFACTVVLKGADTLVGAPGSKLELCKFGNPGMATAGMGDLLSGMIGGLVAQGLSLAIAAKLGVSLHAVAGDQAVAQAGQRGLITTDLLTYIHKLIG